MKKKFYLTTAIPYVNAKPHIGHALEYVIADAIYRYHELIGDLTRIVSGADENALKNVQAAEKAGMEPSKFLDKYAQIFTDFYKLLNVNLDEFRRGTDKKYHWPGVQQLWQLADQRGDIYKKKYQGLYCIGCESFKLPKDLINGKCPDHNTKPELIEEENYFFRLTKYQTKLAKLIATDQLKIYPDKRKKEVLNFINQGLEDFSISRSNQRARGVGVPIPNDDSQKMYVWFDALTIYLTASGYGYNQALYEKWWPADLHIIGKDIIRFHAVYWPAMLMSANLPLPKAILVHGFITSGGLKMSKTIGNVIDPYQIIEKYGVEALRYYLLSQIPTLDDGDFTIDRFEEVYNANLANGLGNLVARIAKLCQKHQVALSKTRKPQPSLSLKQAGYHEHLNKFEFHLALEEIWREIKKIDQQIEHDQPWSLNHNQKTIELLQDYSRSLVNIAYILKPFMPETAKIIINQFTAPVIKSQPPLFPRIK